MRATIPLTEATLTLTGDPATATAHAVADPGGFRSGNSRRNADIASRRLLDTATWPTITYVGNGLRRTGDAWELTGVLTAHGRSCFLALRATQLSATPGGPTIRCRARLDRHDLGITGLPGIVGRVVTLDLTLHAASTTPVRTPAHRLQARP